MKKTLRKIEVSKLANGYDLSLTLKEFTSDKPGPTLGLSATIHGDEDLPIEILRQFSLELENLNFKGRVLILPVANPLAYGTFTRCNPIDMSNLNTVFPGAKGWNVGSQEGTLSEKIAYAIVTEYIPQVDYFLDFHSGGAVPTVEYTVMYPDCEELGKILGQKYLYRSTPLPGSMPYYLAQKNKPVVVGEFGGGGRNNKYYIKQGLTGIKNVMKYLKMIDGEPIIPEIQYRLKELIIINSKNGGIFNPNLSIESMHSIIRKSDLLGITYNPYTFEEIEHFYGPFNRNLIILLRADVCRVESGEVMFMIGNMDTAEQI